MAEYDYINRCVVCGMDLGDCNPRQLCQKTWCSGDCMKCGSFDCGGLCDVPTPTASPEPSPKRARVASTIAGTEGQLGAGGEDVWHKFAHILLARSRM